VRRAGCCTGCRPHGFSDFAEKKTKGCWWWLSLFRRLCVWVVWGLRGVSSDVLKAVGGPVPHALCLTLLVCCAQVPLPCFLHHVLTDSPIGLSHRPTSPPSYHCCSVLFHTGVWRAHQPTTVRMLCEGQGPRCIAPYLLSSSLGGAVGGAVHALSQYTGQRAQGKELVFRVSCRCQAAAAGVSQIGRLLQRLCPFPSQCWTGARKAWVFVVFLCTPIVPSNGKEGPPSWYGLAKTGFPIPKSCRIPCMRSGLY
jgi:hypothetical protein